MKTHHLLAISLAAATAGVMASVSGHAETERWIPDTTTTNQAPPACDSALPVVSNYTNVYVFPDTTRDQAETSISTDPTDSLRALIGVNASLYDASAFQYSYYKTDQGGYISEDAGVSWDGSENSQSTSGYSADPSVGFDAEGNAYFAFLSGGSLWIRQSTDGGVTWTDDAIEVATPLGGPDKEHLTVDLVSPLQNSIYVAWLNVAPYNIGRTHDNIDLRRSSTGSYPAFTSARSISEGVTTYRCQGVNLAVDRGGTVYAAFSVIDSSFTPPYDRFPEDAIGFNKSVDTGNTWLDPGLRIIGTDGIGSPNGGQGPALGNKEFRAFSWPSMAVGGTDTIYVAWADKRYGGPGSGAAWYKDSDILLVRSTDGGDTWSDTLNPVRVNRDDSGNGSDQWVPWICVDSAGGVDVVFYDCRGDSSNRRTETWVSRSVDHGTTFCDFRVSDVAFEPCLIVPYKSYNGDYIGMAASSNYIYPCWSDNRIRQSEDRGVYQVFTAAIPTSAISGTITANTTWEGTRLLSGAVFIDTNVTVTVAPGSKIMASPGGASLIVLGSLEIDSGGELSRFLGQCERAGCWQGITVAPGGSIDWGKGCVIEHAAVAVKVLDGAIPMTIQGVRIENCLTSGIVLEDSVTLINDTIIGPLTDFGIQVNNCNAIIEDCYLQECGTGLHATGWSGHIRGTTIDGPGAYGMYLLPDPENPGTDSVEVFDCDASGYFSEAHMYVEDLVRCDIDSCQFVTDTADASQSLIGIQAYGSTVVRLRNSLIRDYGSVGFYSYNSNSDLGTSANHGNNSISSNDTDSTFCVRHECELLEMGIGESGGQTDGGGPPDPEPTCELKAEYNWWGSASPSASWFENIDYTPWLDSNSLGKRSIWAEAEIDAVPATPTITLANYPNPFNPATTIEFSLPSSGHARLLVYNVLGQMVREVANSEFTAGTHRVVWDGKDGSGRAVASGIYLYRIATSFGETTRKMTLLR